MGKLPESYNRNGVPVHWTGVLNQDKHVVAQEPSNRPKFHGDEGTIAQDRNGADFVRVPNQPSPQTNSKKAPLSLGMNNGIDITEATNNGILNGSIEVANTVNGNTIITETTNTEYKFQLKKISRSARKRYHMLKEEGIPMEEARKLCRIDRSTLEHMRLLKPQKRNNPEAPQGPPNKTPKTSTEIHKTSLSSNDIPLRVGIRNSQSMSEDQMRALHQDLLTAIMEQYSDGCGPVFLGFSHKAGWVLVTCANQRSKDWLVHQVPYLEPWSGAQLSIIPDQELPKPPRAVTFIPDYEGVSVDEALKLFKAQNSGLNTELWKVRFEKAEKEGKTVYFTIDDPSADALRAQNCQASLGFEKITFKINGQYRVYTPRSTQNQVPATQGGSSKPLSQTLGGKSSDQFKEATVPNNMAPILAARCQLPQAAGRDQVQTIQHRDFQPPAKKTPFAQGSGEITSWKKPAALAVGQSTFRPITQNYQGHGKGHLVQPSLGRPVIKEFSSSAKGLALEATMRVAHRINQDSQGHGKTPLIRPSQMRPLIKESSSPATGLPPQTTTRAAIQNNTNIQHIIQDSQSGRTPAMGRFGSSGESVFDLAGSALANRGRSPQRVSASHGGSFDRNRSNGTKDLDKSSTGETHQGKNTYSSHLGAFALNKGDTVRELTPGGFGARPVIQNPLNGRTPFTHSIDGLTKSDHDGFSAFSRGKLSQVGDPPSVRRTLVQNGMEAATVSNHDGFLGQSESGSGFGGRPIIRDSQLGRTISHDRSGETDRTSDQGSALKTNQAPTSQVGTQILQDPNNGDEAFDQGSKVTKIDLTATDSNEDSPEADGGYHSWVIEDLESYRARLTQGNATGILRSAAGMSPLAMYRDQSYATQFAQGSTTTNRQMTSVNGLSPQGRDSIGARIIGSGSHGRPVDGRRTMTRQSRPHKGLLPPFESQTFEPDNHGRPLLDSRALTNRGSMPGLLSHPSGYGIEPESRGISFQDRRAMVTDQGTMSNRRLLPQGSGSSGARIQDTVPHGRLQGRRGSLIDRDSRPDRRLSHLARSSYGGRQDLVPLERFQGSKGSLTDQYPRTDRRLSPHARDSYGGRHHDLGPHGRFQGSKGSLTDEDSWTDKRLSPLARNSYGGRHHDLETHGRFQGSKGSLTDEDSRTDRRLSPLARNSYGGRQELEPRGRFQGSKGSLTDRGSRSDRLPPHARGFSSWTIEEPQSGRGTSWDGSTAIPRARDKFTT